MMTLCASAGSGFASSAASATAGKNTASLSRHGISDLSLAPPRQAPSCPIPIAGPARRRPLGLPLARDRPHHRVEAGRRQRGDVRLHAGLDPPLARRHARAEPVEVPAAGVGDHLGLLLLGLRHGRRRDQQQRRAEREPDSLRHRHLSSLLGACSTGATWTGGTPHTGRRAGIRRGGRRAGAPRATASGSRRLGRSLAAGQRRYFLEAATPRTASKQGAASLLACAFMQALIRPSPGGTPGQVGFTSPAQALASPSLPACGVAACAIAADETSSATPSARPVPFAIATCPRPRMFARPRATPADATAGTRRRTANCRKRLIPLAPADQHLVGGG